MTQLADKVRIFKIVTTNMFKNLKEKMDIMKKQTETVKTKWKLVVITRHQYIQKKVLLSLYTRDTVKGKKWGGGERDGFEIQG